MKTNLINIEDIVPDAVIDLRYATDQNVVGHKLYSHNPAQLLPEAAEALKKAQQKLSSQNLKLVIWDAYRPPRVQALLRQYCDDDKYVALVSNHSRGITVDITLANSETGQYLDMGTDFDNFSVKAHSNNTQLTKDQMKNRHILKTALEAQDFKQLPTEWWHFDFQPLLESPVIDTEKVGAIN